MELQVSGTGRDQRFFSREVVIVGDGCRGQRPLTAVEGPEVQPELLHLCEFVTDVVQVDTVCLQNAVQLNGIHLLDFCQ